MKCVETLMTSLSMVALQTQKMQRVYWKSVSKQALLTQHYMQRSWNFHCFRTHFPWEKAMDLIRSNLVINQLHNETSYINLTFHLLYFENVIKLTHAWLFFPLWISWECAYWKLWDKGTLWSYLIFLHKLNGSHSVTREMKEWSWMASVEDEEKQTWPRPWFLTSKCFWGGVISTIPNPNLKDPYPLACLARPRAYTPANTALQVIGVHKPFSTIRQ